MIDLLNLIPYRLYSEDNDSLFRKWISTLSKELSNLQGAGETEKLNYIISTMQDGFGLDYLELLLDLPEDPTLSEGDRRARIYSYTAGTEGTAIDIKALISNAYGLLVSDISILPRKDRIVSSDPVENYTYDLRISPLLGIFDIETLRDSIERIHTIHCRLGLLFQFLDFWRWDDDITPLDDTNYVTNNIIIFGTSLLLDEGGNNITDEDGNLLLGSAISQSFLEDHQVSSATDGNAFYINSFVDSMQKTYSLFCLEQTIPDITLKISDANNINVGGKNFAYAGGTSPTFIPPGVGTEIHLLYAFNNGGILDFAITAIGFTPGDPNTYDAVSPGMYPLCEVTITNGDTQILSSNIVDVRPQV